MPGVSTLDEWHLVVNNRRGSLAAAVAALRRRNLAISFGVLLVLAVTMGIIILATRRVQELARLQIDFVAGVSHELRTPLTVISSAADNIADGVVENRQQMAQYGRALRGQSSQLRELVEQILLFAATRDNRQTYSLEAAQVADALDLALENTAELIRGAGIAVECHVSRDLPNVSIDVRALSRCLQNLITNAIKYVGDACCIHIEAKTEEHGGEVTISIRDRGVGISPEDSLSRSIAALRFATRRYTAAVSACRLPRVLRRQWVDELPLKAGPEGEVRLPCVCRLQRLLQQSVSSQRSLP